MGQSYLEIGVAAARERLDRFRIVDVREPAEFGGPLGHIAGAELVPLGGVADAAPQLREGPPLLVVCRSGNRSGKACARLAELGVEAPTNLVGGMIAWSRAGLPVARERPADVPAWLGQLTAWLAVFAGLGPERAGERVTALLRQGAVGPGTPGPGDLRALLDELERGLRAGDPPADLDVVLRAFRSDAEALAGTS